MPIMGFEPMHKIRKKKNILFLFINRVANFMCVMYCKIFSSLFLIYLINSLISNLSFLISHLSLYLLSRVPEPVLPEYKCLGFFSLIARSDSPALAKIFIFLCLVFIIFLAFTANSEVIPC